MKRLTKNKYVTHIKTLLLLTVFIYSCIDKTEKKETPIYEEAVLNETDKKEPIKKLSAGAKLFIQCAACHNLKKGEPNKVGPNLNGIFGRKAGSYEGFIYSDALKASNIVWDENHIRNWLEKPSDYIPGTTMAFIGITNKEQQDVLIKYLKEETK